MNGDRKFYAPWGLLLKLITILSMIILLGMPIFVLIAIPPGKMSWPFVLLPMFVVIIGVFFLIRGYEPTSKVLLIQRLCWITRLDLSDLRSVEVDPSAMSRSLRTFGNGGMFCFAGRFRNKKLGPYRAFATDPKRAVVLRFPDRTVVVTPDRPEEFATKLRELRRL